MIKDFFAKLSKGEKTLLFVTLGFISVALLDALVLGPILSRAHVMDAEIEAKKETIKRNLRIMTFRESIHSEYQGYQSYLDSADKSREEIIGDLLKKIEGMAKDHKIGIINIQPGDIAENPVFQQYKTSLECEGAFGDLLAFMRDLEGSEFLFKITKYSMVPKSKGGESLVCTMEISRVFITADQNAPAQDTLLKMPSDEAQATPPPAETGPAFTPATPASIAAVPAAASVQTLPATVSPGAGEAELGAAAPKAEKEDEPVLSQDFLP